MGATTPEPRAGPVPSMKRRQSRRLACVLCQQRKKKCDRQSPCSVCQKLGTTCIPSIPAPARQRRQPVKEMADRLERCEDLLRRAVSMASSPPRVQEIEGGVVDVPGSSPSPGRVPTTFNTVLNISVTHIPGEREPRIIITGRTTASSDVVMDFTPTSSSIRPDGTGRMELPVSFSLGNSTG